MINFCALDDGFKCKESSQCTSPSRQPTVVNKTKWLSPTCTTWTTSCLQGSNWKLLPNIVSCKLPIIENWTFSKCWKALIMLSFSYWPFKIKFLSLTVKFKPLHQTNCWTLLLQYSSTHIDWLDDGQILLVQLQLGWQSLQHELPRLLHGHDFFPVHLVLHLHDNVTSILKLSIWPDPSKTTIFNQIN